MNKCNKEKITLAMYNKYNMVFYNISARKNKNIIKYLMLIFKLIIV